MGSVVSRAYRRAARSRALLLCPATRAWYAYRSAPQSATRHKNQWTFRCCAYEHRSGSCSQGPSHGMVSLKSGQVLGDQRVAVRGMNRQGTATRLTKVSPRLALPSAAAAAGLQLRCSFSRRTPPPISSLSLYKQCHSQYARFQASRKHNLWKDAPTGCPRLRARNQRNDSLSIRGTPPFCSDALGESNCKRISIRLLKHYQESRRHTKP